LYVLGYHEQQLSELQVAVQHVAQLSGRTCNEEYTRNAHPTGTKPSTTRGQARCQAP